MLSFQAIGENTGKQISHVFPSCILSFMRLRISISASYHNFSVHRNTCHHRNSPCQAFTLIIPLKRFYVDVTGQEQSNLSHQKMRTHKFRCHHPPHHFTHFLITMIFQFIQQLSDIPSLCIIKKRGGMLHRYFPQKLHSTILSFRK